MKISQYNYFGIILFLQFLFIQSLVAQSLEYKFPFPAQTWSDFKYDNTVDMVKEISRFLAQETNNSLAKIADKWNPNFKNDLEFSKSIEANRQSLKKMVGLVDQRKLPNMQVINSKSLNPIIKENENCTISAVTWSVLGDMQAEGILLTPKGDIKGLTIVQLDADMVPEDFLKYDITIQSNSISLRTLVNAGMLILIPTLVDRSFHYSGNERINAYTSQSHREWLYRQGYEIGRHLIGYELQKIFASIDWFESRYDKKFPIGVIGYGEGGLLALYASALDTRIQSTIVSGYFNTRENLYKEPIYRNVFGLLNEFGDAELALMSWPRSLIIEHTVSPIVDSIPVKILNRPKGSPGGLNQIPLESANQEWRRAISLRPKGDNSLHWIENIASNTAFFSKSSIEKYIKSLKLKKINKEDLKIEFDFSTNWLNFDERQKRTINQIETEIQKELFWCEQYRNTNFWQKLPKDLKQKKVVKDEFRDKFWNQIGKMPTPDSPIHTEAKFLQKTDKWTSYAIKLNVWEQVFTWGILLVPHNLTKHEKRPVIVCQHGLEGLPQDVVDTSSTSRTFHFYKGFASNLADMGYVVFAPANLYRGEDDFRVLQRQANPLGLTLFSVIIGQHQRITQWLKSLDFVRADKIGFYGLSYGGKTAMRVPAVIEDYCISICSGDFNEWVKKCSSTAHGFSYMYTEEYDMYEWDLGHSFNYAEMAALIAPRPFMVERGHFDNVAIDEWVGYEYEKVRRHYAIEQLEGATEIEYFLGPHTINGKGTFDFIKKHMPLSD